MGSPRKKQSHDSDSEEESFKDYENPNFRKLYATLSVKAMMGADTSDESDADETTNLRTHSESELPPCWEKHEDDNGPYYWHIPR